MNRAPACHASRTASAAFCLVLAGCASKPLVPYTTDTPPLVLASAAQAGIVDKRARFREIYCAVLEARRELPDHRSCDEALTRVGDEPAGTARPVDLGPSNRHLVAAMVPGLGFECFEKWLEPPGSAAAHVRQFGYDQVVIKVDALSGTETNARQIRDALLAMPAEPGPPRLVLLGYSKGAPDILEALVTYPEIRSRVAAVVSLAESDTLRGWGLQALDHHGVPWPSSLALTSLGALQAVSFAVTGAALVALARGMRARLPRRRSASVAVGALVLVGAGLALATLPLIAATSAGVQAADNQATKGAIVTDPKSEDFINGMADLMAHSTRTPILRWPHEYGMDYEEIFFPALPSHAGHDIWKRDFSGVNGLVSFELARGSAADAERMIDALELFGIGASWGGFESVVLPADVAGSRSVTGWSGRKPIVRLHIGLEDARDLIEDLERGFAAL